MGLFTTTCRISNLPIKEQMYIFVSSKHHIILGFMEEFTMLPLVALGTCNGYGSISEIEQFKTPAWEHFIKNAEVEVCNMGEPNFYDLKEKGYNIITISKEMGDLILNKADFCKYLSEREMKKIWDSYDNKLKKGDPTIEGGFSFNRLFSEYGDKANFKDFYSSYVIGRYMNTMGIPHQDATSGGQFQISEKEKKFFKEYADTIKKLAQQKCW
jgi:hypothetical protein